MSNTKIRVLKIKTFKNKSSWMYFYNLDDFLLFLHARKLITRNKMANANWLIRMYLLKTKYLQYKANEVTSLSANFYIIGFENFYLHNYTFEIFRKYLPKIKDRFLIQELELALDCIAEIDPESNQYHERDTDLRSFQKDNFEIIKFDHIELLGDAE